MMIEKDERNVSEGKDNVGTAGTAYTRRKSVAVVAATRQDIVIDTPGNKQEGDQLSVQTIPTFCGTFEVNIYG